ncbi:hypothetical protein N9924_00595 [bacterium]|nr:hypothetical protein [bacterium]
MMCYKDRTFCPFYDKCATGMSCERAMTPRVMEAAERINLPISRYMDRPRCYESEKLSTQVLDEVQQGSNA